MFHAMSKAPVTPDQIELMDRNGGGNVCLLLFRHEALSEMEWTHQIYMHRKTDINGFNWILFGFHQFHQSGKVWWGSIVSALRFLNQTISEYKMDK